MKFLFEEVIANMPPAFWLVQFFFIGSFVGSFLNVVVYRLPRNCLSVNNPRRSFCPSCKTQLKVVDNIPIFGWLLLRGRCRYCGVKYGVRYPLVELLTAALFTLAAWRLLYGDGNAAGSPQAWLSVLQIQGIVAVMLPWALIDLDLQYIPDRLTFGPLLVFVPLAANVAHFTWGLPPEISPLLYAGLPEWLNSLLSALTTGVAGMLFLRVAGMAGNLLFRRQAEKIGGETMGWADVKIMLVMGVMLGWPKMLAAFFVAIALGASIGYILRRARGTLGVPFGPFLAAGAVTAALATPELVAAARWYMQFLQGLMQ
ncbi:MAG: prepilin peptidase [Planctomycetes bacterium]|nr:prepilin peptidase [Planctomycetota bacterium]